MKKLLLIALMAAGIGPALAQPCTPNPLYVDSVFGVWPDTTENFMPGIIGIPYSQDLNLIVPINAQDINPTFPAVNIDSIKFNGVTGLPPGLIVACASQTPATCTYLPAILGCGVITGIPIQTGLFEMTLNVTGYFTLFGSAVPYPISFTGYRILISEDNTSIVDMSGAGLAAVRSVPNPFTSRTFIEFQLVRATDVKVSVYNLLGESLWSQRSQGKAGANKIPFDSGNLQEGVYLFKVETGRDTYTGRMVLSR